MRDNIFSIYEILGCRVCFPTLIVSFSYIFSFHLAGVAVKLKLQALKLAWRFTTDWAVQRSARADIWYLALVSKLCLPLTQQVPN